YQGFNEYCGWMHTSSAVDVADLYAEKVIKKEKGLFYEYDKKLLPVKEKKISIRYKDGAALKTKVITAYFTHHGPVMATRNGKWISLKSYNRSMKSLEQSWKRTKATGFDDFKKVMDLKANTSNNTVFADRNGKIAYWHGNYIPVRDTKFDWSAPVDGSIKATEYKGLHPVEQSVHSYDPASGWLQNCNSTPFTAAGSASPKRADYPTYMAPDGENFRGVNAVKVLSAKEKYSLDDMITAGYDTHLSAFDILLPPLIAAFEKNDNPAYAGLKEQIAVLKNWDRRSGVNSVATTLAVEWAQKLNSSIQKVYINPGEADQVLSAKKFAETATADQLLLPLNAVVKDLTKRFGKWDMPWGEINRFQRISNQLN
ncbi:MAG: acylase, partial [Sphingobacteriales bacterium]